MKTIAAVGVGMGRKDNLAQRRRGAEISDKTGEAWEFEEGGVRKNRFPKGFPPSREHASACGREESGSPIGSPGLAYWGNPRRADSAPRSGGPLHLQLTVLLGAVPKIEIDEGLARNPRLVCHLLEIVDGLAIYPHRHRLLQVLGVRILT